MVLSVVARGLLCRDLRLWPHRCARRDGVRGTSVVTGSSVAVWAARRAPSAVHCAASAREGGRFCPQTSPSHARAGRNTPVLGGTGSPAPARSACDAVSPRICTLRCVAPEPNPARFGLLLRRAHAAPRGELARLRRGAEPSACCPARTECLLIMLIIIACL